MAARGPDQALVSALQTLGDNRVDATLIAALADGATLTTGDITKRTGLRQPEVSVGMQRLAARDWIDRTVVPREGRGRPMHQYSLSATKKAIRDHYAGRSKDLIEAAKQAGQTIKAAL